MAATPDERIVTIRPVFEYEPTAFLDSLAAYDINGQTVQQLDLARLIEKAYAYQWRQFAFPRNGQETIPGRETFEGSITVDHYSYVVAIAGDAFTNLNTNTRGAGFKLQMFDKGAKTFLFERTFAKNGVFAQPLEALIAGQPFGPKVFLAPFIILKPGILNIEITNLDPASQFIQLAFDIAVPVTDVSQNVMEMRGVE